MRLYTYLCINVTLRSHALLSLHWLCVPSDVGPSCDSRNRKILSLHAPKLGPKPFCEIRFLSFREHLFNLLYRARSLPPFSNNFAGYLAINACTFATALPQMRLSPQSTCCCPACCQVTLETELSLPDRAPILLPLSNKFAHSQCKLSIFMAAQGHIDAQVCTNTRGRESGGCQCKYPRHQADIFTLYIFIIFENFFLINFINDNYPVLRKMDK